MKCLFAIKRLADVAGGAERVLSTICSELAERGFQVQLLNFDQPDSFPFYPISSKVRLIQLGIGDSSRMTSLGEALLRLTSLRKILVKERPDVAIGFMHSIYIPLSLAAVGTGIPVIASEHITIEHYASRKLERLLLILTAPLVKKTTVLSESIRSKYPFVVRKRMVPILNPISLHLGAIKYGLKKSYTLLNVGRLSEQKDQLTLIRSFAKIANKHNDWNLRIIGEGELRAQLEEEIIHFGLQNRISLPGISSQIAQEYLSADLFVISSRYEAFGLVTAEAMSYGLPVIGFLDCPGTNELIKDAENGILVDDEGDRIGQLAESISQLMGSYQLRRTLGNQGKMFVDVNFSTDQVVSCWEKLLHDSL